MCLEVNPQLLIPFHHWQVLIFFAIECQEKWAFVYKSKGVCVRISVSSSQGDVNRASGDVKRRFKPFLALRI
jgi:hypothetical protein